jgi:hypothetical protein
MSLLNFQSSIFNPRPRAGGPRQIREFVQFEGGFGGERFNDSDFGFNRGGGGDNLADFNPIATLPQVIAPTPRQSAEFLAGGLTLAQLDRAARFEVDQGAPIGIFYGRILFALKLVSHLYEPGPGAGLPRNTFTGILGEGWGGLGRHGDWERVIKAWFAGEELTKRFDYTVWFEDRVPTGAVLSPHLDGWNWVATNPAPYSGRYSHQSPNRANHHEHKFTLATQKLPIGTGDTISCWIFVDATNPPSEVMLQFGIGSDFEHRAYWGSDLLGFGTKTSWRARSGWKERRSTA